MIDDESYKNIKEKYGFVGARSCMMPEIITNDNPYVFDYIEADGIKFPALTRKNAEFFEAVVRLDSNYGKDLEVNNPSENYDPEIHANNSKGLYCGSTAYWFDELKKSEDKEQFRRSVLGTVIAVDTANSTHLESCIDGRRKMRDIICSSCCCYEELKNKIKQTFGKNHLLALLTQGIEQKDKKKKALRYNLSFASKYCAYATYFMDLDNQYSKYDNVVSKALPYYAYFYLGEKYNKNTFKVGQNQMDDSLKLQYRIEIYQKYSECIKRILAELKKDGIKISRDEFDHIVWYGLKNK